MTWPSNHLKLATGTMFTLFFAGRDFAPNLEVGGANIQDFLQGHYVAAMAKVAEKLAGEPNVVGFDSLNEPNMGMTGWQDLARGSNFMKQGESPSWFQSFQLGEGIPQIVPYYNPALVPQGERLLNSNGVRAWKDGHSCVWRQHGVWDLVEGDGAGAGSGPGSAGSTRKAVLLQKDYFHWRSVAGEDGASSQKVKVDLMNDYFLPFVFKFKEAINAAAAGKDRGGGNLLVFLDRDTDFEDANADHCPSDSVIGRSSAEAEGFVWAPHWYDLVPLVTKSFRSWAGVARGGTLPIVFGNSNLVREYRRQLAELGRCGASLGGGRGVPTIIGEIGIPFDFNEGAAYESGDFNLQISAMDTTMQALDAALLSATLWNYSPDNTNANGDGWNGEDLSIYSPDQADLHDDIFAGGRALQAVLRPYSVRCAGTPLEMHFDVISRVFSFKFSHDDEITGVGTIIFVPFFQYPEPPKVAISDGRFTFAADKQTLEYFHDATQGTLHTLTLSPALSVPK